MKNQKLKTLLRALLITFALFAAIHLSIVIVASLLGGHLERLNPIEFLGLTVLWPELANMRAGGVLAWLLLINAYVIIYNCTVYRTDLVVIRKVQRFRRKVRSTVHYNKLLDFLTDESQN